MKERFSMTTMMTKSGMPMQEMMPGMGAGMSGMNMMMIPQCTIEMEKCEGGMKMMCRCEDKMAASALQGLCKMMAGGMCSCAMMMNGMVACQCNMMMAMCKCEMMEDGCMITCTSGDADCCKMIQACCDCMMQMMEAGCCCCVMMGGTPICCSAC
jgi:hypothetical protein